MNSASTPQASFSRKLLPTEQAARMANGLEVGEYGGEHNCTASCASDTPLTGLQSRYSDDTPFALSETQSRTFSGWMRPREIFRVSELDPELNNEAAMDDALMATARGIDLVQDVTTDCSVVAGLSAAIEILTGKHSVRLITARNSSRKRRCVTDL